MPRDCLRIFRVGQSMLRRHIWRVTGNGADRGEPGRKTADDGGKAADRVSGTRGLYGGDLRDHILQRTQDLMPRDRLRILRVGQSMLRRHILPVS